ncbi:zinc-binding alcohol dehydrogenase family protein [Paenibacillus taihuensis]|nr:zinc-binding alcohol dehydrogenase family protein [Paenibacillus taihuensis]
MKAAIMTKPFQIGIEEVPKPVPKPNEVLVKMEAAGICGGDIHYYDGTHPYAVYPQIYGHELSGVVVSVGADVTKLAVGDPVIVEPTVACGSCYPCRIGKYNCCVKIDMIGGFRPGGFADFVTVPEAYAHLMPDGMSHEVGALCEPFSIGAQVVHRAGAHEGAVITILGVGPIGLTALIMLKRMYRDVTVYAVDVVAERLARAKQFGADGLINPREQNTLETIMKLTGGEGSHIVIESAGLKLTMEQSIQLVSPGGRIVIVGLTNDEVTFPGVLFTKKEVEIFGSRNNAGRFPEVIDFLHRNSDIADGFVSLRMPFTDIAEALHLAKTKPGEVNKIILTYEG